MFPKLENVKPKYFTQNSNSKCKRTTEEINFTIKQIIYFKEIIKFYSEAQAQNKHVKNRQIMRGKGIPLERYKFSPKLSYRFVSISIRIPFFSKLIKIMLKFPRYPGKIMKNNNNEGGLVLSDFKMQSKFIIIKKGWYFQNKNE